MRSTGHFCVVGQLIFPVDKLSICNNVEIFTFVGPKKFPMRYILSILLSSWLHCFSFQPGATRYGCVILLSPLMEKQLCSATKAISTAWKRQVVVATPLTIHEAHDMMPVWSHDGKTIAFASDRYGDFDVFVMPATGGAPTRLTFNSAHDYPYDFSRDNSQVLFGSGRNAPAASVKFPSPRLFRNVYQVPVKGGKSLLVSAAGMDMAKYNNDGSQIIFRRQERI